MIKEKLIDQCESDLKTIFNFFSQNYDEKNVNKIFTLIDSVSKQENISYATLLKENLQLFVLKN